MAAIRGSGSWARSVLGTFTAKAKRAAVAARNVRMPGSLKKEA